MIDVAETKHVEHKRWESRFWQCLEDIWQAPPMSAMAAVPCFIAAVVAAWNLGVNSLWLDEATVANTILRGDVLRPEYLQTTPVGFALLVDLVAHLTAPTEAWLRFVPFVFGVAAVLLTFLVTREVFPTRIEPFVAALFAATDPHLLAYSETVKPYTADIFATGAIVLCAQRLMARSTLWRWVTYTLAISLCPLISFPSVFAAVTAAAILFATYLRRRTFLELRFWLESHLIAGILVGSYGLLFLRSQRETGNLVKTWITSSPPVTSMADILLRDVRKTINIVFYFYSVGPNTWLEMLSIVGLLVGLVVTYRRHPGYVAFFLGPLAVSAVAAYFQLYPYDSARIILFALPGFLILASSGLVAIARSLRGTRGHFAGVVLLGLALIPSAHSAHTLVAHPLLETPAGPPEEVRELVTRDLVPTLEANDLVYVYYGAAPAFQFYDPEFRNIRLDWGQHYVTTARGTTVDFGAMHRESPSTQRPDFLADLQAVKPRRVWMLFSHFESPPAQSEVNALLDAARQCGTVGFDEQSIGARLIRIDISDNSCR